MENKDIFLIIVGVIIGFMITASCFSVYYSEKLVLSRKQLIDIGYARYTTYGAFEITDVKLKEVLK